MARDTKKCISDFIQHVETLEKEEDPEGNGFDREYRNIHEVQVKNRRENKFSMDVGKLEKNLSKNRYKDIVPYDDHRVILKSIEGDENSDYINASRIMGVKGKGGYIASQGPLAATVNDFWRMVWEYNVEIVFMACRIVELGKIKCKQYWNDEGKSDEFGDITVFTESEEESSFDYTTRKFRVVRGEDERKVTQFHYSGWPDHGIPKDPAHIRDLIGMMREARQNEEAPLVVHCSAGCGRTGAIVAIDFVWTLLKEGKFDSSFNLYELICNFRAQRMSMVQTADQYALVNKVLKTLCEEWIEKMASHTYENVEINMGNSGVVVKSEKNEANEDQIYINMDESSFTKQSKSENEKVSSDSGPEIVEIPPPPQRNTGLSNSNTPNLTQTEKTGSDNKKLSSSAETDLVHKTVIHIGDTVKTGSQPTSAATKPEMVNVVRTQKNLPKKPTPDNPPSKTNSRSSMHQDISSHLEQTSNTVTDLGVRLPRVKGPQPMPGHWKT